MKYKTFGLTGLFSSSSPFSSAAGYSSSGSSSSGSEGTPPSSGSGSASPSSSPSFYNIGKVLYHVRTLDKIIRVFLFCNFDVFNVLIT